MRIWFFSEMAYHPAWEEGKKAGTFRVTFPNSHCDPHIAHGLLNRYMDEYCLADELGLDIMVNEHHATATCMTASAPLALAVLARITKKARLLALGNPIANRPDPVRVAEEMAWIDVMSGGRLEMGLVKGAPYEIAPNNSSPARFMRRYLEAHDLIVKALSTTDGPFNWEGEFFQYRQVNIWPRPVQQPTPPVWMTGLSPESGRLAAERGHVIGTLLAGASAKPMFDAYKARAKELGWTAGPDRFAFAACFGVGATRAEGYRRANLVADYVRTSPIVRFALRTSSVSQMHRMTLSFAFRAACTFSLIKASVSLRICRRSLWPTMTSWQPTSTSMAGLTSPVKAPSFLG